MSYIEVAKNNFLKKEKDLSEYATRSSEAIRIKEEAEDMRPAFFHDIDRMIHASSYSRYLDKTQVYSFKDNDHITKRMIHVQLVSKIARTIGRALNLNEDLIEAIALGHDIGHTPLGHLGEAFLNEISLRELGEYFAHNIQGVRHYSYVENDGKGLNISIQILDGIMCHNGEMLSPIYKPMNKTKDEVIREYEEAYKDIKSTKKYSPMTLEGCVVRISDIIGYIGRDIEDAITLGKIKREVLPKEITEVIGSTNKEIVNTIIMDIIKESLDKPYIKMSEKVFVALTTLKKFNYENIYNYSYTTEEKEYYRTGMNKIFNKYVKELEEKDINSNIYNLFYKGQSEEYRNNTNIKRVAIDYIAGMTDDFFHSEIEYCFNND